MASAAVETPLYDVKQPDWSVAVAFRMVRPEDRCWPVRCFACLMCCTDTAHVELLLRRPCLGPKSCPYNHDDTLNGKNDEIHDTSKNGGVHVLSYAIRNMPDDNTVICAVEPIYQREAGWVIYGLRMKERQIDKLEKFCLSQIGGSYRCEFSLCCNWLCSWFCCCCVPPFPCGASINQALHPKKGARSWFCSEFVTAALIHCGFLSNKSPSAALPHPAKTSPETLRKLLASMNASSSKVYTLDIFSTKPTVLASAASGDAKSDSETDVLT